jgi:cell division topological specificity factor
VKLFRFFTNPRTDSAPQARERLQILLAHERALVGRSDLVAILREEILKVIAKHVAIDSDKVRVKMDKTDTLSTLEVDLEIRAPATVPVALAS